MKNTILLVQIFLMISLISCKKDKDEIFPEISLSSPTENSQYNVLEDVSIRATITDNEIIKQVQVSLFESVSNIQVLGTRSYAPGSNLFELALTYSLSDSLLPSGTYYFKIEAQDNENTATVFQHVHINGIPKKKLAVFAICSDFSSTTLYSDNNDFNFSVFATLSEPYYAAGLNSYDQQFWLAPKGNDNIKAYQLNKKQLEFEQDVNSSYTYAFTDLKINERDVLFTTKDGDVWGFNSNYSKNYNYRSQQGRTINSLNASEKYIVVDEVDLVGSNRFVNVLYGNTGAVKVGISIRYPVVDLFFLEEEKVILFQNDENGGRISEVTIQAGAKRTLTKFADSILEVKQLNSIEYLISTPSKVVRYNYTNGNVLDYISSPLAVICYEPLANQVYIASGNQLDVYYYPFTTSIQTASLPDEIEGIKIRYNR